MKLNLFSGGAAKAVVTGLQAEFEQRHGATLQASFGAVGTMRDQLLAGAPCDVIILSDALIKDLEKQGHVVAGSARPLGRVETGVAVRTGEPAVAVDDGAALKATLAAARGLYVPHLQQSTAGQHIANVLRRLGLDGALAGRIHEYPNGAVAMGELARTTGDGMIGCTQVTEILYTPGVTLVGELPKEYGLSTVYTAACCSKAADPAGARAFVDALGGADSLALRRQAGFVV
ncbi:molybdate ABC transporter substrate-binding protein [Bordetella genomosp. 11]|uniref:Molybdate ABC transporter substrate-binding protein n=1 Tax=Bordetella genomosp. 11 TaxID=1416808 RepID=A0A261UM21_9BORD|nr:substrate-binding domain-containing protein [Bordetella genomosp. 11]OZI61953.1 molybdate ABC transporter substrate-binding protein [Bordetella genomosp. 11]